MSVGWIQAAAVVLAFYTSGVAQAAPAMLVGKLTKQYVKECDKDGKARWVAPYFQIGFIRVVPAKKLRLERFVGKTVAAHGRASTKAPPARPSNLENCRGRQMRSDWVESRGGDRVRGPRPGLLGRVKVFHVTRIKPTKLLRIHIWRGQITAMVRNTLPVALPGLTLHARYERCFYSKRKMLPGKPMPAEETHKLGVLKPGRRRALKLPVNKTVLPKKFKKTHALREVYLYSAATGSLVDLSQPVKSGVDLRCR